MPLEFIPTPENLRRIAMLDKWIDEQEAGNDGANERRYKAPATDRQNIVERARRYIDKAESAISGQHGHDKTFYVACKLVQGFGLTIEEAYPIMQDYSFRCDPPWSEREIRHKLDDAFKGDGPRGYLLVESEQENGHYSNTPKSKRQKVYDFPIPIPASQLQHKYLDGWIWKGYLAKGTVTLFTALWKAGKTTLLAHLIKSMETGGDFCGYPLSEGRVLYVTEESESRWCERRDKLQLTDNIEFLVRPFGSKASWEQWTDFLEYLRGIQESHPFDLIVFDTISNLWPVGDENDASQVQKALMPLHRITEDAALLLVHHNRKGDGTEGTTSRGSGAFPAFVDTIVEFRRYDPTDDKDRRRTLKGLGRYDETPIENVIELTDGGYISHGDKVESKARDTASEIFDILSSDSPGITLSQIDDLLTTKLSRLKLYDSLENLIKMDLVTKDGEGNRSSPFCYRKNQ